MYYELPQDYDLPGIKFGVDVTLNMTLQHKDSTVRLEAARRSAADRLAHAILERPEFFSLSDEYRMAGGAFQILHCRLVVTTPNKLRAEIAKAYAEGSARGARDLVRPY